MTDPTKPTLFEDGPFTAARLLVGWSRLEEDYARRLKLAAEALRYAQAAYWDAHYGNGISKSYAQSVDRRVNAVLKEIER